MSENTPTRPGYDGDTLRSLDKSGVKTLVVVLDTGGSGTETLLNGSLAVTGPLTDAQLRATAVAVSGTFWQTTQPVSGAVTISGSVAVTGTFWQATQPVSIASMPTTPVTGTFWQTTQPISGTISISGAVAVTGPLTDAQLRATAVPVSGPQTDAQARAFGSNLWITAVAAVNTALTATLPAVAGLFHYITAVELVKGYSVVGVAAGAGVTITTTNLPGNPAFSTEQLASAAGTRVKVIDFKPALPFKSSVVNTATTFVAPAQLQTIWRWNIAYYTGP